MQLAVLINGLYSRLAMNLISLLKYFNSGTLWLSVQTKLGGVDFTTIPH